MILSFSDTMPNRSYPPAGFLGFHFEGHSVWRRTSTSSAIRVNLSANWITLAITAGDSRQQSERSTGRPSANTGRILKLSNDARGAINMSFINLNFIL